VRVFFDKFESVSYEVWLVFDDEAGFLFPAPFEQFGVYERKMLIDSPAIKQFSADDASVEVHLELKISSKYFF
jgi:hypothetical protein